MMGSTATTRTAVASATAVFVSGCDLLPQNDSEWTAVWIIVGAVVVFAVGFAIYMAKTKG